MSIVAVQPHDALLVVDVQNDFVTGSLAIPGATEVVPALNRYLELFAKCRLPVVATRDWHPTSHCSFRQNGGPWPTHCIAGTHGADFAVGLALPRDTIVISKAMSIEADAYSGFDGTNLATRLRALGIARVLVGGLATDYCVLNTVLDALRQRYDVVLLLDAVRAVNLHPGDGDAAEKAMCQAGAIPTAFTDLARAEVV